MMLLKGAQVGSLVAGPRRGRPFLSRVGARQEMCRLYEQRWAERRVCLDRPDGIGTTSLANEFFHEHKCAFPDAYIEVAARQPDGRRAQQGKMLGQALSGLGMADAA